MFFKEVKIYLRCKGAKSPYSIKSTHFSSCSKAHKKVHRRKNIKRKNSPFFFHIQTGAEMASFLAEMPQSMNCSLFQTCLFVRWRIHPMYYKRELLKRRRHIYRVTNRGHDLFFFPPRKSQCSNPANIQATLSHLSTKTTCVQKRTTFLSLFCFRSFFSWKKMNTKISVWQINRHHISHSRKFCIEE